MNDAVAIAVLTHNHAETLDYILDKNLELYKKYGMDVYVCDDSDDDQTKNLIEKLNSNGYENLYYADAHGVETGNEKYYEALKQTFFRKQYKYTFPIKDRASFSERIIELIAKEVENDYDVIMVVNDFERWEVKLPPIQDVYTDPALFFSHYGQLTTNWRSMIFSNETILNSENMNEFEERYGITPEYSFAQTTVTFAGLAKLNSPKIRVIHATYEGDADETVKYGAGSGWLNKAFKLWVDDWTKAIFSLPEVYNQYKASVLKAETNLNVLFGSIDGLLAHKGRGVLTKEVLDKYRSIWTMISGVPIEWVDLLLNNQFEDLLFKVYERINYCLQTKNYDEAYYAVVQNKWIEEVNEAYKKASYVMFLYKLDCYSHGQSDRLNNVNGFNDLICLAD